MSKKTPELDQAIRLRTAEEQEAMATAKLQAIVKNHRTQVLGVMMGIHTMDLSPIQLAQRASEIIEAANTTLPLGVRMSSEAPVS